jgi:hypothetical protein
MLTKAPFLLPPGWLDSFGYSGPRRFVALWWEPCGDEASYSDGCLTSCGACDNWLFLDLIRRRDVRAWLDENGLHLGNSDEEPQHWLIVDAVAREVFAAPWMDARLFVLSQTLPDAQE